MLTLRSQSPPDERQGSGHLIAAFRFGVGPGALLAGAAAAGLALRFATGHGDELRRWLARAVRNGGRATGDQGRN